MKTERARSGVTTSSKRPNNQKKKSKAQSNPKDSTNNDNNLSPNVIKIIMGSRFSFNSMMILSLFVDAKGESLYDGDVKKRFKEKFKFDVEHKTSTLLTTFSERGLLRVDEIKSTNPEFKGRGNYRKYYFATDDAEELIEYVCRLNKMNA